MKTITYQNDIKALIRALQIRELEIIEELWNIRIIMESNGIKS